MAFLPQTKKVNNTIKCGILNLVQVPNFILNQQFWINFRPKKCFVENRENKTLSSNTAQSIGLGTKFHLNTENLVFCANLVHKGYLLYKTEKVKISMKFNFGQAPKFHLKQTIFSFGLHFQNREKSIFFVIKYRKQSIPKIFTYHVIHFPKNQNHSFRSEAFFRHQQTSNNSLPLIIFTKNSIIDINHFHKDFHYIYLTMA